MTLDVAFSTECIPITIVESKGLNHSHLLQEGGNHKHNVNIYGASGDNPVWVTAAKVGQLVRVKDKFKTLTREAIVASLGTWKNGSIIDDHNAIRASFNIYSDKFEEPFLCFLLDEQIASDVSNSVGGSIDARATEINDEKVTKMVGVYITEDMGFPGIKKNSVYHEVTINRAENTVAFLSLPGHTEQIFTGALL